MLHSTSLLKSYCTSSSYCTVTVYILYSNSWTRNSIYRTRNSKFWTRNSNSWTRNSILDDKQPSSTRSSSLWIFEPHDVNMAAVEPLVILRVQASNFNCAIQNKTMATANVDRLQWVLRYPLYVSCAFQHARQLNAVVRTTSQVMAKPLLSDRSPDPSPVTEQHQTWQK